MRGSGIHYHIIQAVLFVVVSNLQRFQQGNCAPTSESERFAKFGNVYANKEISEETELIFRRVKRNGASNSEEFDMKFRAFDTNYETKLLRPRNSIFSPSFQFLIWSEQTDKKVNLRDVTPAAEVLQEIENGYFINPSVPAAVSISEENGFRKIRDTVGNLTVESGSSPNTLQAKKSQVLKDLLSKLKVIKSSRSSTMRKALNNPKRERQGELDYIDAGQNVIPDVTEELPEKIVPELLVIIDKIKFESFGCSADKILEYLGLFFYSVNNYFASKRSTLDISFRIVSVVAFSSNEAEILALGSYPGVPYMKNSMETLSKWIYDNMDVIGKHDIAIFLTGNHLYTNGNGFYRNQGWTYLNSACYLDHQLKRSFALAMAKDIKSNYEGAWTVAHELAHTLGAVHDGEPGAEQYTPEDGHIMSNVVADTPNQFIFSKSSMNLMYNYITSSGGLCLLKVENIMKLEPARPENWSDSKLCQLYTGYIQSSGAQSERGNCGALVCSYSRPGDNRYFRHQLPLSANDGQYCLESTATGRCKNGKCVRN